MWVESISLENIKCFQNQKISFTRNESNRRDRAKPYGWITLLGENGVGKSTLLQALALLLAGPEAAKELLPRPTGWVRDPSSPGKLSATLHQEELDLGIFGDKKIRRSFSYSYFVTGTQVVQVGVGKGKETYTEPALVEEPSKILSWLRTNAFASNSKGWFSVGYGAFRRLTRVSQVLIPSLDLPKRSSNFTTQFNEDSALNSFERWMVHLDYRLAKEPNDVNAQKMRRFGEAAITKLLPGDVEISEVTADGLIQFSVDGRKVPTISLSDGFRSVIALAGDLIWRLMQAFPDLEDPAQASGVVLIDELDIHLHPSWQREISGWLQEAFPNLQFFVATHSPLVAAGGGDDALTLRLDTIDGDITITQIKDLSALDADRILRSPAFGLSSTHSPLTERKINRYHRLRQKRETLTNEEKNEYGQLSIFMRDSQPIGGPPEPGSLEARMDEFLKEKLL